MYIDLQFYTDIVVQRGELPVLNEKQVEELKKIEELYPWRKEAFFININYNNIKLNQKKHLDNLSDKNVLSIVTDKIKN